MPACALIGMVPNRFEKRLTIMICALGLCVGLLFAGPSQLFHLPDSVVYMGIGQGVLGIFFSIMIPGLPEMVEAVTPLYPSQEKHVKDLSSGVYSAMLGGGQIFAPLFGSYLTDALGFRTCYDWAAGVCLLFAVSYFLASGVQAIRKTRENYSTK